MLLAKRVFGDHPAVTPEPVIAFDAPAGNAVLNATALDMVATMVEVAPLVRVQLLRPSTAGKPSICSSTDDEVLPVGSRNAKHLRRACLVSHDVALAAKLALFGGIEPVCGPPEA